MPASTFCIAGEQLARALTLHDQGVPRREIARDLGVAVSTLQNAIAAALCARLGHTPAERTASGRLSDRGRDRLREALRKGMRGTEIQLRLGVAAGTVSKERASYAADLKRRGKRPLPPPGGGERYGGARLSRAKLQEIEAVLLTGVGAGKAAKRTGVSKTPCLALRARLVRRLARKGLTLPGCDERGRRRRIVEGDGHIPAASKKQVHDLILAGVAVAHAAKFAGICGRGGYLIRDELKAELESGGERLPAARRLTRDETCRMEAACGWLPSGRPAKVLYRRILAEAGGDTVEARRRTVRALAERAGDEADAAEWEDHARLSRMPLGTPSAPRDRPPIRPARPASPLVRSVALPLRSVPPPPPPPPIKLGTAPVRVPKPPMSFEEQLAAVAAGRALVATFRPRRADPDYTLGGVASGALG